MPLFRNRKSKSPSQPPSTPSPPSRYPARSVEQLVHHPAFVAPPAPINNNSNHRLDEYTDNRVSDYRLNYDGPATATDLPLPPLAHQRPPQLQEPTQFPSSSLHRSQSQRQPPLQRDRPTVSVVTLEDQPQPRRSKKSLFVRPASGFLERKVSVKGKSISHPVSQPTSPHHSPHRTLGPTDEDQHLQHPPSYSDNPSPVANHLSYDPQTTSFASQQQHYHQRSQQSARDNLEWPPQQQQQRQLSQQPPPPPAHQSHPQSQSGSPQQLLPLPHRPLPSPLERSNTDPSLLEQPSGRPSPTDASPDSPRYTTDHLGHRGQQAQTRIQQDLVFNFRPPSRPPSRQTREPTAPVHLQIHPDAMQQASPQVPPQNQPPPPQQPPSTPLANERAPGESSRRGSAVQTMPEPGRGTPTGTRTLEDPSEIDVRALLQKHEELQTKYSKVKRYYFDKEAQVQHLQNTVAHQRMAVSRTVLDDNEYANRFTRLDGAIKDLAFSVRKDWRGIPPWLHGLVTDDATTVGTKEMTAVGRAVISRWLVEEVFQRHFHPALDPTLSVQLKSIEMNLRQQMRPATDEERENAIARLSNWRRTTFDGLGDTLSSPAAQAHRAELVEHSTAELASFLSSQLHEAALPGLEAGVRMIIENTINITEKIPLEARDVCVEYFPPNIPFVEGYMKVEGGLPPLTHQPPLPADPEPDDTAAVEDESLPASSSAGPGESASAPAHKPLKKSVFGVLMGRKPASPAPTRAPAVAPHEDKPAPAEERDTQPRIRFASFVTVEVRGKGPPMALVKAPVWMIE
ncbi:hypothetical protein F1880_004479 [Penicillium rolfsii]|nr:hypothetical protein F1880_004479 [Penicillium rolfsii]